MSTPVSAVEVIVIGGGPAGLATAAELAHHGVRSVLVEPRTEVSHTRPRAKTTSPRTMELLRRWGIADAVRDRAPLAPGWNRRVVFCDRLDGAAITEFHGVFGLSDGPHELFAESGQQVAQPIVEEVLREHLRASGLVELRWGERATSVVELPDEVLVTLERADGTPAELRAPYVVGADGGWSVARSAIGAKLEGTSAPAANLNAVFRSRALRPAMGEALHYWVIGTETPGAVGPLDRDGLWWAGLAGVGDRNDPVLAAALIRELAGVPVPDLEVLSTDPWTPRMLLADRFASERVFLVGESAHLNPPFGGHGFNTCVGDAVNVGWKLAAVLQGWGGPNLLATYEVERRRIAEQTIASATTNLRASGHELARTADALQRTKAEEFYSLGLTLGYGYAGSPIVAGAEAEPPMDATTYVPSTRPGARLPHVWLDAHTALYDRLGRGLTVLHPGTGPAPAALERFRAAARTRAVPLEVVARDDDGLGADEVLLVRPDQHITWRGDLEGLVAELLDTATGYDRSRVTTG
ncbi:FAD-dependent oxidoreductase [Nocardioides endophyticus]|uniref:FAD-dependent oxidoreductase n=1 Tax=Nocardioides endophyticus TaxID=1353775 RepID=A0ABP8YZE2_9ACTN